MKLDSAIYSCRGGREVNEDFAGSADMTDGGLFVLADGLGGHCLGELASECVVSALLDAPKPKPEDELPDWLQQQIEAANEKLAALQKDKDTNMRSTIVALAIQGGRASWAHVGDSRLYFFHRSAISAITEDHSVAFRKYKAGEITRAQIGWDADQSILLRTLGNAKRCRPDLASCGSSLEPGDAFLLCTDGMWENFYDEEALIDLLKARTAQEWVDLLLLRVMERLQPGNDNLSLIAVLVQ